ncbi:MAG: hypothetical protein WEB00_00085 [Dehalococcoidia bacterium]
MGKILQVRDLPDEVHAELVRRAKQEHYSLSRYVGEILVRETSRLPMKDWLARLRTLEPVDADVPAADLIREAREERDEHLEQVFEENQRTWSSTRQQS